MVEVFLVALGELDRSSLCMQCHYFACNVITLYAMLLLCMQCYYFVCNVITLFAMLLFIYVANDDKNKKSYPDFKHFLNKDIDLCVSVAIV